MIENDELRAEVARLKDANEHWHIRVESLKRQTERAEDALAEKDAEIELLNDAAMIGDKLRPLRDDADRIRAERAEAALAAKDAEIARLSSMFHALDDPQKSLAEMAADRDSWEQQADDRVTDVMDQIKRAETAESALAAMTAERDELRAERTHWKELASQWAAEAQFGPRKP